MRATLDEAAAFLAANPDIRQVSLILTDLGGIARGKSVRVHELAALYASGRPLPSSILSLDAQGEDVEETGLVWDIGDMDCRAFPVAGTLKRCPWLDGTAQVLLSMGEDAGLPVEAPDPRFKLSQMVRRFAADGITPVLACELEFYLLDKRAYLEQGKLLPARLEGGFRSELTQVYGVAALEDLRPFFDDIYAAAEIQGLPAETAISEYAPGQFELTLTHRANALQAADEAVIFKRLIKGVADRHGLIACFMAKPFTEFAGSGMHVHISLTDKNGHNLFAAEDLPAEPKNALLAHAIGGLQHTVADAMALFAPNANSYRRFRTNSYAPVAATWGVNNRTVTFRVPTGGAASRRVEHRLCGADVNPYLAAAAILAGMHHGIAQRIDPGPAASANAYKQADPGTFPGPALNWPGALADFARSGFIKSYFGDDFARIYLAIKRHELEQVSSEVTALDLRLHLRNA